MIDYGLVFVAGLLVSMHCIGMCGPIVIAYSTTGIANANSGVKKILFAQHVAYNTGRILAYGVLGGVVGLAGSALGDIKTMSEYIALVGGGLMVLFGLGFLGFLMFPRAASESALFGVCRKPFSAVLNRKTTASRFLLGIMTPLLPCGVLYAMLIKAVTAGSVMGGAATMAIYGLGMAPSLILVGSLSNLVSKKLRRNAEKLAAIAIIIMGATLIMRGLHIPYVAWLTGSSGHMQHH